MSTTKTEILVGDMFWAKMPLPEHELNKMLPSHRIRPYLIVKIDNDVVYAYQAFSNKWTTTNNWQHYAINHDVLGYNKVCWIDLRSLIKLPIYNLNNKLLHLSDKDLSLIEKRLHLQ